MASRIYVTYLNLTYYVNLVPNMTTKMVKEIMGPCFGLNLNEFHLKHGVIFLEDGKPLDKTFLEKIKIIHNDLVTQLEINAITFKMVILKDKNIIIDGLNEKTLIKELKHLIGTKLLLPPGEIILKNEREQVLDDEMILEKCINRCDITMQVENQVVICVFVNICGQKYDVDCYREMTISKFKTEVYNRSKIKVTNNKITYQGQPLEDNNTLEFYKIGNNYNIVVEKVEMFINVDISGNIYKVKGYTDMTIAEFRTEFFDKKQIRVTNNKMTFQGKPLNDEKTFEFYNIVDNSLIVVDKIELSVDVDICGNKYKVKGYKDMTIAEFRTEFFEKTKIKITNNKITFQGKLLDYEKTFEFYNIINDSVIVVDKEEISVCLSILKSNYTIKGYKDMTIEEFKTEISKKTNIAKSNFNLSFSGNILDDKKTLDFYEIENNSTIFAISVMYGGQ